MIYGFSALMVFFRTDKMQKPVFSLKPLKPFVYTYCCQGQPRVVKAGVKQTFIGCIHTPDLLAWIVVSSIALHARPWPLLRAESAKPGVLQEST